MHYISLLYSTQVGMFQPDSILDGTTYLQKTIILSTCRFRFRQVGAANNVSASSNYIFQNFDICVCSILNITLQSLVVPQRRTYFGYQQLMQYLVKISILLYRSFKPNYICLLFWIEFSNLSDLPWNYQVQKNLCSVF